MRIAQLVTRRQRRGGEIVAANLSTALSERGHDVFFAGIHQPFPTAPLAPERVRVADVSAAIPAMFRPQIVTDLARYFECIKPDVIQANGGYAMKYSVLAAAYARVEWPILYCNIGHSSDWLRLPGQRQWNQWLVKKTAITAAVGEASRRDLIETYELDPDRVEVVRRGVPMDTIDPVLARRQVQELCGFEDDSDVVLHVGSFSPEKNHDGLLRIMETLRKTRPKAHLVLIGDGPSRQQYADTGYDWVSILGVRDDVSTLMAGADVLVLPSITEGVPGVILEAGVQRLPVVAYNVGGVEEAMIADQTGFLTPLGDEAGFIEKLLGLLRDPKQRHEMGERARAFIEHQYDLDRSVDEFEALYHRVAKG